MNNRAAQLTVGTKTYTYFPVSQVEGYAVLPYSLTVLLENILRNARSDEEAKILSERLVEAGTKGVTGEEDRIQSCARAFPGLHGCAGLRRFCRYA